MWSHVPKAKPDPSTSGRREPRHAQLPSQPPGRGLRVAADGVGAWLWAVGRGSGLAFLSTAVGWPSRPMLLKLPDNTSRAALVEMTGQTHSLLGPRTSPPSLMYRYYF